MRATIRQPEECPKCTHLGVFDIRYLPLGSMEFFPCLGSINFASSKEKNTAVGPCMMKTCRVCGYTYTEPPADGETGEEK